MHSLRYRDYSLLCFLTTLGLTFKTQQTRFAKSNHLNNICMADFQGHKIGREGSKGSISYAFSADLLTIMMATLFSEYVPQRELIPKKYILAWCCFIVLCVCVSVNISFPGHEDGLMLLRLSKYMSLDTLMSKPGNKLSQYLDDFWHVSRPRKFPVWILKQSASAYTYISSVVLCIDDSNHPHM